MIRLKKGKMVWEVSTEVQASAFLNNGYVLVEDKPEIPFDIPKEETYTKDEIMMMSATGLKKLATSLGIPDTGKRLKEDIIARLGL